MMKYILMVFSFVGVDQLTKYLITNNLNLGEVIWPNKIFEITNIHNYGAAWNIFNNQRLFLICLTLLILLVICWLIWKNRNKNSLFFTINLILILSGALGNLIDRIANGYVVDMIALTFVKFPVFNVADMFLCIGVFGLIICILKGDEI